MIQPSFAVRVNMEGTCPQKAPPPSLSPLCVPTVTAAYKFKYLVWELSSTIKQTLTSSTRQPKTPVRVHFDFLVRLRCPRHNGTDVATLDFILPHPSVSLSHPLPAGLYYRSHMTLLTKGNIEELQSYKPSAS